MCRGLALLMDKKGKIYCDIISSHTELLKINNLKENDCLKYEVIMDETLSEGYRVTVDEQYGQNSSQGKEAKELIKEIKKYCKENQLIVWKGLAHCQTYRKSKGNQDARGWSTKKGDQYSNYWSTEEGNQYSNYWSTEEGNQYARGWSTKKGDQYSNYWSCSGFHFIAYTKVGDEDCNNFIKKISNEHPDKIYGLKWRDLVRMAMKCPEKEIEEILSKSEKVNE